MPIRSTSLAHYLGKGLILPTRFYNNRPYDIQNIENDYLILSKNKFLNDSNVSIELILTDGEIESLTDMKNNVFLYSKPIPISRIKQIYFKDERQKLITIDNINKGVAFIPTTLSRVIGEENVNVDITVKKFKYSPELESKIKTYDHILGGVAFVQYTLENKYSKNYFSILSYFNNFIKDKIDNRFDKYDGVFTGNRGWDKIYPLLYKNILEKDVFNFSNKEEIDIKKLNGIFKYETIDPNSITYKLAILNTYGEDKSKRKNTNDLISDFKNGKIPKEKQEGIALIYGINNGYSSFRNKYDKKIVKFKMDSLLDYYTIESIFQYAINDKKDNGKFEYIDKNFPNKELVLYTGEKTFDLEKFLYNLVNDFEKNVLKIPLKDNINNIINKFKKIFLGEIDKKDKKIKSLEEEVANQKDKLKQTEQKLEEKDNKQKEELYRLNQEITNKDSLNKQLDEKIKSLEEEVANQKDKLKQMEQKLEEKDNKINDLKKQLEEKNQKLLTLEQTKNNKLDCEEEKERIIKETLKLYSKKIVELKSIAKRKGIICTNYTKKSDLVESILKHKENKLF